MLSTLLLVSTFTQVHPVGLVAAEMLTDGVAVRQWDLLSNKSGGLRIAPKWQTKLKGFVLTNPYAYYVQLDGPRRQVVLIGSKDNRPSIAFLQMGNPNKPSIFPFYADGVVRTPIERTSHAFALQGFSKDQVAVFDGSKFHVFRIPVASNFFWSRDSKNLILFGRKDLVDSFYSLNILSGAITRIDKSRCELDNP